MFNQYKTGSATTCAQQCAPSTYCHYAICRCLQLGRVSRACLLSAVQMRARFGHFPHVPSIKSSHRRRWQGQSVAAWLKQQMSGECPTIHTFNDTAHVLRREVSSSGAADSQISVGTRACIRAIRVHTVLCAVIGVRQTLVDVGTPKYACKCACAGTNVNAQVSISTRRLVSSVALARVYGHTARYNVGHVHTVVFAAASPTVHHILIACLVQVGLF